MPHVNAESLTELVQNKLVDTSNVEQEEYDGDGCAIRFDYGGLRYRISYFLSKWKGQYVYTVEEVRPPFLVANRKSRDVEYKIFSG